MTTESNSYTAGSSDPVVVAVDGSAASYEAVAWAAAEASLHRRRLHVVTSTAVRAGFGPAPVVAGIDLDELRREGERVVVKARRVASTVVPGDLEITSAVVSEPVIPFLLESSRRAWMMAVGSHGLGAIRRMLLGSVSSAVLHHAHCRVAVVHENSATDPVLLEYPVLVGVDGTANSEPALHLAFEEASRRKVELVALHAWSDTTGPYVPLPAWESAKQSEDAALAESLAGWGEQYPDVTVRRILVRDAPARALLTESDSAQLLVAGSHGRGGFTGLLLGSTSTALVQSVRCPVIVVRERGAM
ncbi:universal stress protein [Nocardia jiangxiensis]|uniref:Universal stress protein n=1 Tax=Nocardia jiangxiensis TaxID=282685 RepID=A0ABW6RUQ7_9NOCA